MGYEDRGLADSGHGALRWSPVFKWRRARATPPTDSARGTISPAAGERLAHGLDLGGAGDCDAGARPCYEGRPPPCVRAPDDFALVMRSGPADLIRFTDSGPSSSSRPIRCSAGGSQISSSRRGRRSRQGRELERSGNPVSSTARRFTPTASPGQRARRSGGRVAAFETRDLANIRGFLLSRVSRIEVCPCEAAQSPVLAFAVERLTLSVGEIGRRSPSWPPRRRRKST